MISVPSKIPKVISSEIQKIENEADHLDQTHHPHHNSYCWIRKGFSTTYQVEQGFQGRRRAYPGSCAANCPREEGQVAKGEIENIDIASIALSSGQFSDENIVDQMTTFLVAGHETVATSLQWAVFALCKHPEMQVRLREEIRSHISATIPSTGGRDPQTATAAQLDSLPYLNAFCKEVLRFYPPVRSTVREASKDTFILDSFIPKGTTLSIVPGAINLDKGSWGPAAEEFNPERWIGEGWAHRGSVDSSYSFLTFLHGPRSCIGQSFAKSEFVCLVAVLAGRFQMELQDPMKKMEVITSITVSLKDGVLARLTRIEGW